MRTPTVVFLLGLTLLHTGCDGLPSNGEPKDVDQRIATLNGFRLGMLLPDAYRVADSLQVRVRCEDGFSGDAMSWCKSRNAAGTASTGLLVQNGSIVLISAELGESWATVPRDTLTARLTRELGSPEAPPGRTAEGRYRLQGFWKASNSHDFRALYCVSDSAESCGEEAVRFTPAFLIASVLADPTGVWPTIGAIECPSYIPKLSDCSKRGIAPQIPVFSDAFPKVGKGSFVGASEIPQNYYNKKFEQMESLMEPLGPVILSGEDRVFGEAVRVSARFDSSSNLIYALVDRKPTALMLTVRYDPEAFYPEFLKVSTLR